MRFVYESCRACARVGLDCGVVVFVTVLRRHLLAQANGCGANDNLCERRLGDRRLDGNGHAENDRRIQARQRKRYTTLRQSKRPERKGLLCSSLCILGLEEGHALEPEPDEPIVRCALVHDAGCDVAKRVAVHVRGREVLPESDGWKRTIRRTRAYQGEVRRWCQEQR